jgi:hypothetical protein
MDRLAEQGLPVQEMRGGMTARDSERFANRRAEWFWGLRTRFEDADIDIPDDDELLAQLTSIKWRLNSRGQIIIESKDDMKSRGLPSPDKADTAAYAFAAWDMPWDDVYSTPADPPPNADGAPAPEPERNPWAEVYG